MALYDGFFDFDQAVLENTGTYDREYNAESFTDLLDAAIGSGVYVGESPDSMKVSIADGSALVAPGYLFFRGYWLANRAGDGEDPATYPGYYVTLPTSGAVAIAARLDYSRRMIEIVSIPQAETYTDCLVLALIDIAAGSVTDTRADASFCGLIDSAGSTAAKASYAVNYIDNEIEGRLDQAEADIAEKSAEMDAKIAEVSAQVAKLAPPPIGTIKYTASENVDSDWLPCDGRFVNETDYPDLVAALGKLTPSADKFQLLSAGEVPQQISNGVLYAGRMWVYSYSSAKLYGIDVEGDEPIKEVTLTSTDTHFTDFIPPTVAHPLCLSITPHTGKAGAKLFLSQIIQDGGYEEGASDLAWLSFCLLFQSEFTGDEDSLSMEPPFTTIQPVKRQNDPQYWLYPVWDSENTIPYVESFSVGGEETFYLFVNKIDSSYGTTEYGSISWTESEDGLAQTIYDNNTGSVLNPYQRIGYSGKNSKEGVWVNITNWKNGNYNLFYYNMDSYPNHQFDYDTDQKDSLTDMIPLRDSIGPMNIVGEDYAVSSFDIKCFPVFSRKKFDMRSVKPNLNLPSAARVFVDGAAYLWGKAIYMFFVGTGIIFSRTLEEGSFGYLDTTSVLGTITQFGYLDYSQDEGTLYLLGQDTTNQVKLAKIVLNTLYDYANDGAWLPQLASDGVPAYIKAIQTEPPSGDREVTIKVTGNNIISEYFAVYFNDGRMAIGKTYTRTIPDGTETFTVGLEHINASTSGGSLAVDNSTLITIQYNEDVGTKKTATLRWEDYSDTITISVS